MVETAETIFGNTHLVCNHLVVLCDNNYLQVDLNLMEFFVIIFFAILILILYLYENVYCQTLNQAVCFVCCFVCLLFLCDQKKKRKKKVEEKRVFHEK